MDSILTTVGLLSLLLYFLLSWQLNKYSATKKNTRSASKQLPPEPAGSWPVIGHLHLLAQGSNLPHINLGAMADKYGPAFMIRIGLNPTLVVSSWDVAKEIFTTNDQVFSSRPIQVATKHLGFDTAMYGFAPYGPYWREISKLVKREVLSNTRLEFLKPVWGSEVNTSIKELYEVCVKKNKEEGGTGPVVVEMKQWFSDLALNMSVKLVAGKRYFGASQLGNEEAARWQKALRNCFRLVGLFVVPDAIPFLRWLDLGGHEREMKNTAKELDDLLEGWLEEHKMKKKLSLSEVEAKKEGERVDFMDVMLSILEHEKASDYFEADTINKATCLALILGGTDTTTVVWVWALALLVNHPNVLKKAEDELDIHVGKERQVDESDIKNLTYLQAIIKESMRLYPAATLGIRESTEDCTVAGYHIPAGTRLIVNSWKIQHDPQVWTDPFEFQPERFLTSHVDVDIRGQSCKFLPFGSGRRSCPGTSLALQMVTFTLARLIHGFEFRTPSEAPTDMTESAGLTNVKATPLEVLVSPRLRSELYVC